MKKVDEKDIRNLEHFGSVTALLTAALSLLYFAEIFQEAWVLNTALVLGALMHLELALLQFLRRKYAGALFCMLLMLACVGFLIYLL